MRFIGKKSTIKGSVVIPGSKSHTIRALAFSTLADGESVIRQPLFSSDTESCLDMIRHFGAVAERSDNEISVKGRGTDLIVPDDIVDVGNSGTSLYIGLGMASLLDGTTVFTGDHQIRNRPADALMKSLNDLGSSAISTRKNGKPPIVVSGPLKGGKTSIESVTSQYLTALLIAAPMADNDTHIDVPLLYEKPYVTMTLRWLDKLGISYTHDDYKYFDIKRQQSYSSFEEYIPADFSSATFFLVAAAISGATIALKGLDFNDTQGDKEVVTILQKMGADVTINENELIVSGGALKGGEFDLNAIPDALPALSVAGCFASGETRLVNVPQARLKETDRIHVMCQELKKMGADIEELEDGLVIRESELTGTSVHGHGDHRVVMSLSVASLMASGETLIDTAESTAITFPNFIELMRSIGANIDVI